LGVLHSQYVW
jgi:hypothetical protein